ncbi:GGDEF domain-containing protein [Desulfonatronum lacustre]|uniref:GGDEF domain-containing protein n=1 Tax=Desulfonatronum lacustre TaxID=66849 RepID=UPI00048DBCE5|nr:diguanylate cyclase [Desulfonatronum lacustre]
MSGRDAQNAADAHCLRERLERTLELYRQNLSVFHKFKLCASQIQAITSLDQLPALLTTLRGSLKLRDIHLVLDREQYAGFLPDSIPTRSQLSLRRMLREMGLAESFRHPLLGSFADIAIQAPTARELFQTRGQRDCLGSVCVFPLWDKYQPDNLIGFLALKDGDPLRYNEGMATDFIEFFADLFSWSLVTLREHEKLQRESTQDHLTGCHNRSYLMKHAPRILEFAHRKKMPVALLFIDLDGFKKVNDTLGHACGDQLLVAVAHAIQNIVRDYDIFIRLGGDEFLLLLPDVNRETAQRTANRIQDALRTLPVAQVCAVATQLRITASIGLAMHRPGETLHQFIQRADTSMYSAKPSASERARTSEST